MMDSKDEIENVITQYPDWLLNAYGVSTYDKTYVKQRMSYLIKEWNKLPKELQKEGHRFLKNGKS